jgi:hypothetical protein
MGLKNALLDPSFLEGPRLWFIWKENIDDKFLNIRLSW